MITNYFTLLKLSCSQSVSLIILLGRVIPAVSILTCLIWTENINQLKKQLQNVGEALEETRQTGKNEEHKTNQLLAEKVGCKLCI